MCTPVAPEAGWRSTVQRATWRAGGSRRCTELGRRRWMCAVARRSSEARGQSEVGGGGRSSGGWRHAEQHKARQRSVEAGGRVEDGSAQSWAEAGRGTWPVDRVEAVGARGAADAGGAAQMRAEVGRGRRRQVRQGSRPVVESSCSHRGIRVVHR